MHLQLNSNKMRILRKWKKIIVFYRQIMKIFDDFFVDMCYHGNRHNNVCSVGRFWYG